MVLALLGNTNGYTSRNRRNHNHAHNRKETNFALIALAHSIINIFGRMLP